ELVPAVARGHVHHADVRLYGAGHPHQHVVADVVSEGVVDGLERPEVHVQHAGAVRAAVRAAELAGPGVVECAAVGQAGELVRQGGFGEEVPRVLPVEQTGEGRAEEVGQLPGVLPELPGLAQVVEVEDGHHLAVAEHRQAEGGLDLVVEHGTRVQVLRYVPGQIVQVRL